MDSEIDKRLEDFGSNEALELREKAGVANARLAYAAYQQVFVGRERFGALLSTARGATVVGVDRGEEHEQSDTLYVTEFVAKNTNTMPEKTMDAVADHGEVRSDTVIGTSGATHIASDQLTLVGTDLTGVFLVLENEGVDKFEKSWGELIEATQDQLDAKTKT